MTNTLVRMSVGIVGVTPGILLLNSGENFTSLITAGFLNAVALASAVTVEPGDFIFANYSSLQQSIFIPSIDSHGVITLIPITAKIAAGVGINVTYNGDVATITNTDAAGGGTIWNDVTAATQTLVAGNGYTSNHGSAPVTFSLPATAIYGEVYKIATKSIGGWILTQGNFQQIVFGDTFTSIGSGGSLSSSSFGDSVELLCIVANTKFQILNVVGNLTFV